MRFRRRRFRCSECGGLRFRRFRGTGIHKRCWYSLVAELGDVAR